MTCTGIHSLASFYHCRVVKMASLCASIPKNARHTSTSMVKWKAIRSAFRQERKAVPKAMGSLSRRCSSTTSLTAGDD